MTGPTTEPTTVTYGPECPFPPCLDTPWLESQSESATSSSHVSSTSLPAFENEKVAEFIYHWIRNIRSSDRDPNALTPRLPVDRRLEDETVISDDDSPYQISDDGHPDRSQPVVHDQASDAWILRMSFWKLSREASSGTAAATTGCS